jgi:tRNA pseudouridine38-40 synthase
MPRYFIEVSYRGTAYSGFQIQENAITIQSEIEKALSVYFRQSFSLTGSSRTDAGVHSLQNYFHFDADEPLEDSGKSTLDRSLYNLNAILPGDIVVKRIFEVHKNAHCRFDAISREYWYHIYQQKDPFLQDRAYYFPYKLDFLKLSEAAALLYDYTDFTSFSKKNTQVNNFNCEIKLSEWKVDDEEIIYKVKANRFLRGMVKGLVGTMLRVGTGKTSSQAFENIILNRNCSGADFSVPSHGLFLQQVQYK